MTSRIKNWVKFVLFLLIVVCLNNPSHSQVVKFTTKICIVDGVLTQRKSYTINVRSSAAREVGDISIWVSSHSKFKLINAEIKNKFGKVVRTVKKKDLSEESIHTQEDFFRDGKIVKFNLFWHEYPYQITYSYEESLSEFLSIVRWYPAVYTNIPTMNSSLELQIPLDYEININSSPELTFSEDTLPEGIRQLKWNIPLYNFLKKEKFAPPWEEYIPQVIIVPNTFKFDIVGSNATWADFGNWIEELNSNTDNLPQSETKIIDSLILGCKTKKDIIRTLYHYLQDNNTYVNVSIGYGGLKSYPASYVCQNRYGDCKALTTYMKAILKHAGIESYYTVINSGINQPRILESFPASQFNHILLCVPVDNDTLWLENTSSDLPFNYSNINNQDRFALLINGTKSKIIKMRAISTDDVAEFRKYNYYLDENGSGSMSAQGDVKGYSFEKFSYIDKNWDEENKKEAVIDYFDVETINDWKIEKADRDDPFISVNITGNVAKQIKKIGELKVIKPSPIEIAELEKPEDRKLPLRFNYPINQSDSIIFHLPYLESYSCQLPDSISIESKYGLFTLNANRVDNKIRVFRQLIISKGDYPVDEYRAFFEFIRNIKQSQKNTAIILTPNKTEIHE